MSDLILSRKLKSAKRKRIEEDSDNIEFKCVMCKKSFKSMGKLAEHQYYDCTGGW